MSSFPSQILRAKHFLLQFILFDDFRQFPTLHANFRHFSYNLRLYFRRRKNVVVKSDGSLYNKDLAFGKNLCNHFLLTMHKFPKYEPDINSITNLQSRSNSFTSDRYTSLDSIRRRKQTLQVVVTYLKNAELFFHLSRKRSIIFQNKRSFPGRYGPIQFRQKIEQPHRADENKYYSSSPPNN